MLQCVLINVWSIRLSKTSQLILILFLCNRVCCERICSVFHVVCNVKELLSTAFDEAVQRVLHQLQVLQLFLGLLPVLPQKAGDLTASSEGQTTDRQQVYSRVCMSSYELF